MLKDGHNEAIQNALLHLYAHSSCPMQLLDAALPDGFDLSKLNDKSDVLTAMSGKIRRYIHDVLQINTLQHVQIGI